MNVTTTKRTAKPATKPATKPAVDDTAEDVDTAGVEAGGRVWTDDDDVHSPIGYRLAVETAAKS